MKAAHLLPFAFGFALSLIAEPLSPSTMSVADAPSTSASGDSSVPVLSANGRYVSFLSSAKNLVTNDDLSPYLDLFRHDLVTGETILIAGGSSTHLRNPAVSSNGQTIAYSDGENVYCVDANSLARALVSADVDGNPPPNAVRTRNVSLTDKPLISADGRWVAFESFATNLTTQTDTNNESDVFLRDTLSNRTVLISIARAGGTTGNRKSELIALTPDGHYVLFASTSSNFVTNTPTSANVELFVRDPAAGITTLVPPGDLRFHECRRGAISSDGRFVLFKLELDPNSPATIYLHDRLNGTNLIVTANARAGDPLYMSSDARFIAYDQFSEITLWDRQTNLRTRIDSAAVYIPSVNSVTEDGSLVAFCNSGSSSIYQLSYRNMTNNQQRSITQTLTGAPSNKDHRSSSVTIDSAGQFIVFDSADDNLAANDRNHACDIFVHFLATGETRLISRAHPDLPAFTPMAGAKITNHCVSADGTRILFFSTDSNLVPGDTNGWQDAFLRDLRTGRTSALTTDGNGRFWPNNSAP